MSIAPKEIPVNSVKWTEDLRWQARRAVELAGMYCTCLDFYHLLWAPLRAAHFVGSLSVEETALSPILSRLIGDQSRVLIIGAADPGTFCVVGRSATFRIPQITILDRCLAPLKLIEAFAAERELPCRVLQGNILSLQTGDTFDLALVHYTLGFIPPDSRQTFFESTARRLVPGAHLVCLLSTGKSVTVENRSDLEDSWRRKAREAIQMVGRIENYAANELEKAIHEYAQGATGRRNQLPTVLEVSRLLTSSGFEIVEVSTTARRLPLDGGDLPPQGIESAEQILGTSSMVVAVRR